MLLYHPELDMTHEFTGGDEQFEVVAESGWRKTIPGEHDPAHAALQPDAVVVYQPVSPAEQAGDRAVYRPVLKADEAKPATKATTRKS